MKFSKTFRHARIDTQNLNQIYSDPTLFPRYNICVCFCVLLNFQGNPWQPWHVRLCSFCFQRNGAVECAGCKCRWYQPCQGLIECMCVCVFREGRVRSNMSGLESQETSTESLLFTFLCNTRHHLDTWLSTHTYTHSALKQLSGWTCVRQTIRYGCDLTGFGIQTENASSSSQSLCLPHQINSDLLRLNFTLRPPSYSCSPLLRSPFVISSRVSWVSSVQ